MPVSSTTAAPHLHHIERTFSRSWRWWAAVHGAFELDPHHVAMLTLAAEALDRAGEAHGHVALEGAVMKGHFEGASRRESVGARGA